LSHLFQAERRRREDDKQNWYQFSSLKIVPADSVEAGFAFSIGKNSKIRARRTEPRIHFKAGIDE